MPRKKSAKRVKVQSKELKDAGKRGTLMLIRNGVIGSVALGGAAWWGIGSVRATVAEHDLTRLGKGLPAVVQIHDPTCAMCTQLQRSTRKAMRCFEDEELLYLVANIQTPEGARFARQLSLPHVTLVLMDGAGEVQDVLQGVRSRDDLKPYFQTLAA